MIRNKWIKDKMKRENILGSWYSFATEDHALKLELCSYLCLRGGNYPRRGKESNTSESEGEGGVSLQLSPRHIHSGGEGNEDTGY